MSGITAVQLLSFSSQMNKVYGQQALTVPTRAKLVAIGVDVSRVRTEAEGQRILHEAEIARASSGKGKKAKKENQEEALREKASDLAKKLNISVYNTENLDDIIVKLRNRIRELKSKIGDDFDKRNNLAYYERHFEEIVNSQMSMINLNTSMSLTANMNMAFHNLI